MRFRTATASTFASTSRSPAAVSVPARARGAVATFITLIALATLLVTRGVAAAGPSLDSIRGHFGLGYAQLMNTGSPGGSLGFGAGLDLPVRKSLRFGVDIGFELLGSQVVERDSVLSADLEYSLFETFALLHWIPREPWRISIGPGLVHSRADLSSSSPVAFGDLAVDETAPGGALSLQWLTGGATPLRAGLEVGVRTAWMEHGTWTVMVGRVTVHY